MAGSRRAVSKAGSAKRSGRKAKRSGSKKARSSVKRGGYRA